MVEHAQIFFEIVAVVQCVTAIIVANQQDLVILEEFYFGCGDLRDFYRFDGTLFLPVDHVEIAKVTAFNAC